MSRSVLRQIGVRIIAPVLACGVMLHVSTAASATGNAASAKACQQGGYQQVVRADGSALADEGACVSHAARGGTFVPVRLTGTFVPDPNRTYGEGLFFQNLTVRGSGLQPGSTVTYSFVAFSTGIRSVTAPTVGSHVVAPDGTFATAWQTGCPLDHTFEFSATTAYGAPITATGC